MHQIPALVAKLASEQATLSALQGVLTARLLASRENAATSAEWTDRLLTAEQVATILGVTKRVGATPGATTALCSTPVSACRALFGIGSQAVDGESADANRVKGAAPKCVPRIRTSHRSTSRSCLSSVSTRPLSDCSAESVARHQAWRCRFRASPDRRCCSVGRSAPSCGQSSPSPSSAARRRAQDS